MAPTKAPREYGTERQIESLRQAAKRRGVAIVQNGRVWRLVGPDCDILTVDLGNVRPEELRPARILSG